MDNDGKIIEPTAEENKELHMPADFERESKEESLEKTQQIKINMEPSPSQQEVSIPEAELDRIAEPAPELRANSKKKKTEPEPEYEDEDDDEYVEETEFEIRVKSFPFKPMTPEEAILQMNLLGHAFFAFYSEDWNGTCVVYKRKDENYGMIVPEAE